LIDSIYNWMVSVLQKDTTMWDEAARACETLVPHLKGSAEKKVWLERAEKYRDHAQEHRRLVSELKRKLTYPAELERTCRRSSSKMRS